jgi:hypothetical protein
LRAALGLRLRRAPPLRSGTLRRCRFYSERSVATATFTAHRPRPPAAPLPRCSSGYTCAPAHWLACACQFFGFSRSWSVVEKCHD